MAQQPLTRPPQEFPHGARRQADAQWLAYVADSGDTGDGASLSRSGTLRRGIAEFNDGRFRDSHDTFEELWRSTPYPERLFLLALTKLGAGFAHALRRNEKGMRSQLTEAVRILRAFAPAYAGVDTQRLIDDVEELTQFVSIHIIRTPAPRGSDDATATQTDGH